MRRVACKLFQAEPIGILLFFGSHVRSHKSIQIHLPEGLPQDIAIQQRVDPPLMTSGHTVGVQQDDLSELSQDLQEDFSPQNRC